MVGYGYPAGYNALSISDLKNYNEENAQTYSDMTLHKLKFPIGEYRTPEHITPDMRAAYIRDIKLFPERLKAATQLLSYEQLDTPYREGGWTIRQVVHHCADSHSNSLTRFKLALTEDRPVIKPYMEALWAELPDSKTMRLAPAFQMLEGIHERWVVLLKSLTEAQLQRTFIHPESKREITLAENMAIYAWHCNHHLAHVTSLKVRMGWV